MSAVYVVIIISITLAALGVMIELSSNRRVRKNDLDGGKRPFFMHRNLRLMGNFRYRNGKVYYHCLSLGPFPFAPIGCYVSESRNSSDIQSSQKGQFLEIFALYSRWGWIVALVAVATLIA